MIINKIVIWISVFRLYMTLKKNQMIQKIIIDLLMFTLKRKKNYLKCRKDNACDLVG